MDKNLGIVLLVVIVAMIWLGCCIEIKGRNKKYVILAGVLIDIVLLLIGRRWRVALYLLAIGLLCGLGFGCSPRKYKKALREYGGVKNWIVAYMIFFMMIFLSIMLVYPEVEFVF